MPVNILVNTGLEACPQNGKAKSLHILTCLFHRTWIVTDVLCGLWRGRDKNNNKSQSPLEKSEWMLFKSFKKLSLANFD